MCVRATHCCRYSQQTGRLIWCQLDPVAWRLPWLLPPPSWCHKQLVLLLPCLCMPKSPVHLRRLIPLNGDCVLACTFMLKFEPSEVVLSLLLNMYLCLSVHISIYSVAGISSSSYLLWSYDFNCIFLKPVLVYMLVSII